MSAEFIDMSVTARYLFAPSTLPLTRLLMKSTIQALENLFSFHSLQIEADTNQFRLAGGMGEFEGVPIQQLYVDPVSITFAVVGDRADSDRIYEGLRQFLIKIDSGKRMENPTLYAVTYQTQSTVKLSVPHERLLSSKLINFLHSNKENLRPGGCPSAELRLSNLSFQVTFKSPSDVYSLLPKVLTIEPRAGSDPNENMYYVVTPTDSDVHKRLVEEFEKGMRKAS